MNTFQINKNRWQSIFKKHVSCTDEMINNGGIAGAQ